MCHEGYKWKGRIELSVERPLIESATSIWAQLQLSLGWLTVRPNTSHSLLLRLEWMWKLLTLYRVLAWPFLIPSFIHCLSPACFVSTVHWQRLTQTPLTFFFLSLLSFCPTTFFFFSSHLGLTLIPKLWCDSNILLQKIMHRESTSYFTFYITLDRPLNYRLHLC